MQQPATPCSDRRISDFLDGLLTPEDELSFERHMDHCESCRTLLEERAAGEEWWRKPTEYLANDAYDKTIYEQAGEVQSISNDGLRRVLELLGPTENAEALGRINDYDIIEPIGFGGMAIVLKGYDAALDRYVAIKILAPHLASSTAAQMRFSREARAAAAVHHPNVIAIHNVSEFQGLPYLVMPYVSGGSLQERLDDQGPFDIDATLLVGKQIAAGLAAAHKMGIVHRDIKPANVLLDPNCDRIVITDFGLARAADDASITQTGILAGTPHYMSPEQARGDSIDHRSDLFSLGSLLYTLASGELPFQAENSYGVLRQIIDGRPKSLTTANPDVPAWLSNLVSWLHKSDVEERCQSAITLCNVMSQTLVAHRDPTKAIPEVLQTKRPTKWRSWLILTTLLVVVTGVVGWRLRSDNGSGPTNIVAAKFGESSVKLANTAGDWPADGEWVTFTGRFVMEGALPERRSEQPSRDKLVYSEPFVDESLVVNPVNQGIANVFVWLSSNAAWPEPRHGIETEPTPISVRYEAGRLQPHVILLRVNQPLQLVNRDPIQHFVNVGTQERIRIAPGKTASHAYRQQRSQPQRISCEYHPWFQSFALVTDHRYVAVSDANGQFQIDDIPSGRWTVHVWHEMVGHVEQIVDENGLVQAWPAGEKDVDFDRPHLDAGDLIPSMESIPAPTP